MPKQTRRVTDQSHTPLSPGGGFPPQGRVARIRGAARVFALVAMSLAAAQLHAQEGPSSPGEAIGRIFEAVKLRNTPPPPPDFVVKSRGAPLDYKPLLPTDRENHRKPAAELQSIETEMASAAERNKAAASRVAIPDGAPPPAAKPATAGKKRPSTPKP